MFVDCSGYGGSYSASGFCTIDASGSVFFTGAGACYLDFSCGGAGYCYISAPTQYINVVSNLQDLVVVSSLWFDSDQASRLVVLGSFV